MEFWRLNLSKICKGMKGRKVGSLGAFNEEERSVLVCCLRGMVEMTIEGGKGDVKYFQTPNGQVKSW
jgi:hypothetical protein